MRDREVRSIMVRKGVLNREIAKKLGVSEAAVSMVVSKKRVSRRIQQAVADALNKKFSQLWTNQVPLEGVQEEAA